MKIVAVVVAMDGFRAPAANGDRIAAGKELIRRATQVRAGLVELPAGYLTVPRHAANEVEAAAAPLLDEAKRRGIALVLGVDTGTGSRRGSKRRRAAKSDPGHRYWVIGVSARGTRFAPWEQRAVHSGSILSGKAERRFIEVAGRPSRITVLACGEVFQPDLRAEAKAAGTVAVTPSHTAWGARYSRALTWARRAGLQLVRSVHAVNPSNVTSGLEGTPLDPLPGPPFMLPRLIDC